MGSSERQLSARLKLNPPPISARQLDRLVLRWGLIAVGDPSDADDRRSCVATSTFARTTSKRRSSASSSMKAIDWKFRLLVARDGPLPEPQEVLFQEYASNYSTPAARAIHLQSQSNVLTERGAQMRLTFGGDFTQNPPKTLRLTYPRIRDNRAMCSSCFATCRCRRGGRSESAGAASAR